MNLDRKNSAFAFIVEKEITNNHKNLAETVEKNPSEIERININPFLSISKPSDQFDEKLNKFCHGGAQWGKFHFEPLLWNQCTDLNQTWWGLSLGGRDPKLVMRSTWTPLRPHKGDILRVKRVN